MESRSSFQTNRISTVRRVTLKVNSSFPFNIWSEKLSRFPWREFMRGLFCSVNACSLNGTLFFTATLDNIGFLLERKHSAWIVFGRHVTRLSGCDESPFPSRTALIDQWNSYSAEMASHQLYAIVIRFRVGWRTSLKSWFVRMAQKLDWALIWCALWWRSQ